MNTARKSASPFSSLFAGSEAAKVIDFLLSMEQYQEEGEKTAALVEGSSVEIVPLDLIDYHTKYAFHN
ncbi:MAG: hypothetical protein M3299_05610 [Thermoproteota archaeon]|nr:hypothetical protein [Thermoproteota archaeon]